MTKVSLHMNKIISISRGKCFEIKLHKSFSLALERLTGMKLWHLLSNCIG